MLGKAARRPRFDKPKTLGHLGLTMRATPTETMCNKPQMRGYALVRIGGLHNALIFGVVERGR